MRKSHSYQEYRTCYFIMGAGGLVFLIGFIILVFGRAYNVDLTNHDLFLVFGICFMVPGSVVVGISGIRLCIFFRDDGTTKGNFNMNTSPSTQPLQTPSPKHTRFQQPQQQPAHQSNPPYKSQPAHHSNPSYPQKPYPQQAQYQPQPAHHSNPSYPQKPYPQQAQYQPQPNPSYPQKPHPQPAQHQPQSYQQQQRYHPQHNAPLPQPPHGQAATRPAYGQSPGAQLSRY